MIAKGIRGWELRTKLFYMITLFGCIAIGCLTIEVFVRLFADDGMRFDLEMWKYARIIKDTSDDPKIGHVHRPMRQAKLMGVDFETNSKGLRDREFSYTKSPNTLRILMLGDSLTVGWGVRVEDTFSKRLETMYAHRGVDVEVINTGVGNYNTIQEIQYFFTEGHKYLSDIVVLNYFVNDAEPVPHHHRPSILKTVCFACVLIGGRLDAVARIINKKQDWADYYLSLYEDGRSIGWLNAKANIRRLAEYCRANGIKLLIASLPELHDIEHYRFQRVTDLVHGAAKEYGAEFVDILPYLENYGSSELWVAASDPHPNALAHSLIVQGLFEALEGVRSGKFSAQ